MAVEHLKSKQILSRENPDIRLRPLDEHGKFRMVFFELNEPVVTAGDAGTTVELAVLPPGAVRIIPNLSRLSISALGASRTLNIGHRAYGKRPAAEAGATEPENPTAFVNAMDVSAALNSAVWSTALKYDVYSVAGVMLFATINGGTLPQGATFSGFCTYLYE